MLSRRTFAGMLASSAGVSMMGCAGTTQGSGGSTRSATTVLYRTVGAEVQRFGVDVDGAARARRGTVTVPAGIQYVWPHPSKQYLYVASSNRGPGAAADTTENKHHLTAFRVDTVTGALAPH